jgi:hypothetical protein
MEQRPMGLPLHFCFSEATSGGPYGAREWLKTEDTRPTFPENYKTSSKRKPPQFLD